MESKEMKQVLDLDTLTILVLGVLAFVEWIDPSIKIGFLAVGILTLIFRIIKDRKAERRAIRSEARAKEEHEQAKAKRAEEHAEHEQKKAEHEQKKAEYEQKKVEYEQKKVEHELRMKLLQKELEEKEQRVKERGINSGSPDETKGIKPD